MTPVKKTTPPPSTSAVNGDAPEGPWKEDENGRKVRNGRALPLENKLRGRLLILASGVRLQDEFIGLVVENSAEEIAYGWANLAQEDPRVKRILSYLLEGSAWAEALAPTLTVIVLALWHYDILVPDRIGAPLAMISGVLPVSREVETQMKEQAKAEEKQRAAAEAQVAADKPINGDTDDVDSSSTT